MASGHRHNYNNPYQQEMRELFDNIGKAVKQVDELVNSMAQSDTHGGTGRAAPRPGVQQSSDFRQELERIDKLLALIDEVDKCGGADEHTLEELIEDLQLLQRDSDGVGPAGNVVETAFNQMRVLVSPVSSQWMISYLFQARAGEHSGLRPPHHCYPSHSGQAQRPAGILERQHKRDGRRRRVR